MFPFPQTHDVYVSLVGPANELNPDTDLLNAIQSHATFRISLSNGYRSSCGVWIAKRPGQQGLNFRKPIPAYEDKRLHAVWVDVTPRRLDHCMAVRFRTPAALADLFQQELREVS
jgi:hypothetical protein